MVSDLSTCAQEGLAFGKPCVIIDSNGRDAYCASDCRGQHDIRRWREYCGCPVPSRIHFSGCMSQERRVFLRFTRAVGSRCCRVPAVHSGASIRRVGYCIVLSVRSAGSCRGRRSRDCGAATGCPGSASCHARVQEREPIWRIGESMLAVLCRILPHYRLAVFERLSKMPGIRLMVYYSREPSYSSLKTIDPRDRFPSRRIEMKAWKWAGQEVLFQPKAREIVDSHMHDVVILSGNLRLLSNLLALVAARRRRIGVVWWTMGRQPLQSRISMRIGMWLTAICDAVLVYTHDEKTFLYQQGDCRTEGICCTEYD